MKLEEAIGWATCSTDPPAENYRRVFGPRIQEGKYELPSTSLNGHPKEAWDELWARPEKRDQFKDRQKPKVAISFTVIRRAMTTMAYEDRECFQK